MKYPFRCSLQQNGKDLSWIAESEVLPHVVGQGKCFLDALNELEENEEIWIFTANRIGATIPNVPVRELS